MLHLATQRRATRLCRRLFLWRRRRSERYLLAFLEAALQAARELTGIRCVLRPRCRWHCIALGR